MYIIRLVKENDIDILADVFSKSFTEADKEKPWDKQHSEKYLSYWLTKQPDMFFGAFDENEKPLGAVAVNIKPWRTGTRCTDGVIFVDTQYQRQGIGKSLLKKVLEEALGKYNASVFEAITFANETFPLTWYKKLGIKPDEQAVIIKGNCVEILNKLSQE